jgi:DNA topoisomerase VI subunit B
MFKNEITSIEYVLSEFIDNSLASYENGQEKCDFNGLEISIKIEQLEEMKQIITITDNALGMSQEQLADAIQPYNQKDNGGTQINQYGVGMKLAIF